MAESTLLRFRTIAMSKLLILAKISVFKKIREIVWSLFLRMQELDFSYKNSPILRIGEFL
jgi:hypothetical protein